MSVDVLTVSYGDAERLLALVQSLAGQTSQSLTLYIWHNGPGQLNESPLQPSANVRVVVCGNGQNLGYGAGINRIFAVATAPVVVVVNPDVCLASACIQNLIAAATAIPTPVLVGGALATRDGLVNAFALSLTLDGLGINVDRGKSLAELRNADAQAAETRAVAPSGALFAVNRAAWFKLGGGPLFVESLFLYLEDVALGLRVRRLGGALAFCAQAQGQHRFSDTTGPRSALKLFHVERNRLWLLRALGGRGLAVATMPFTLGRFAAYAARSKYRFEGGTAASAPSTLCSALLRAWKEGLFAPLPQDLVPYLGVNHANVSLHQYMAPFAAQLRDPTA